MAKYSAAQVTDGQLADMLFTLDDVSDNELALIAAFLGAR
jgi:hypothetical protein